MVKNLYLDGNSLEFVSEMLLDWPKSDKVLMGQNPWRCDCALSWMFHQPHQPKDRLNLSSIVFDDYMLCRTPERLRGLPMQHVTETNLGENCSSKSLLRILFLYGRVGQF